MSFFFIITYFLNLSSSNNQREVAYFGKSGKKIPRQFQTTKIAGDMREGVVRRTSVRSRAVNLACTRTSRTAAAKKNRWNLIHLLFNHLDI